MLYWLWVWCCFNAGPTAELASVKPSKPAVESLKKENVTLKQRIEILDWHNTNSRIQMKTANHFHTIYPNLKIKQPLISAWVKDEARWWAEYESNRDSGHSAKRVHQTLHPEVMEMLELWVLKVMADKLLLTGEVLCQKWKVFANLIGVPDDEHLNLSEGWLSSFKTWNGLKRYF